jgi:murein DD-endopeptidase MepM/ murein hydrolase activator NlpD
MKLSPLFLLALVTVLTACAQPAPPQPSPTPAAVLQATPTVTTGPAATSAPLPSATTAPAIETPSPLPSVTPAAPTEGFFHPARLSYAPDFADDRLQAFLAEQAGPLKEVRVQIGSRSQSFAAVLTSLSSLYSFSPKVMLALIEAQSGLLTAAQPTSDQIGWAVGYQADGRRGIYAQLRWASLEIRQALRDYALGYGNSLPPLEFADGSEQQVDPTLSLSRYVLARVLAPTTTPGNLNNRLDRFLNTYSQLFEDPRPAPTDWPEPAEPFLSPPMEEIVPITSFFDHDTPFLQKNGSLLTFWGRSETDIAFAYDGHTGWDYALAPPDLVLAAAEGRVIFAGNSDDGCATPARAVIVDHGNGYRTLYWHLATIEVEAGQVVERGAVLGMAGESGCVTGPHLHFQVQYLGRDVDPYGWCGSAPDNWALNPAGQKSVWLWRNMPSPCGPPPPGIVVVDDRSPGFRSSGEWQQSEIGYNGGSLFIATQRGPVVNRPFVVRDLSRPAVAVWQPELPAAGRYRVLAYIPYALNGLNDARDMRFLIRHNGGLTEFVTDAQDDRNWWVELGVFEFDPEAEPFVSTSNQAADSPLGVWADAIAFVPVEE